MNVKTMLTAALITASAASNADILVMGVDRENKALVALTDTACEGVTGKVAGVRTEAGNTFVGCWTGKGNKINIYFPKLNKSMTYDVRIFRCIDRDFNIVPGGIRDTI